jgi:hypothetical protein
VGCFESETEGVITSCRVQCTPACSHPEECDEVSALQKCFSSHRHYVQGVAWDPLGAYVLTLSTDRTMRVHRARASKKQSRADASDVQLASDFVQSAAVFKRALTLQKRGQVSVAEKAGDCQHASGESNMPSSPCADGGRGVQNGSSGATYIFQDEGLNTFFRRLTFSPEGSFVVAPAATLGPSAPAPQYAPAVPAVPAPQCAPAVAAAAVGVL